MDLETDLIANSVLSTSLVSEPDSEQVKNALHLLDGETRTQLWLHASDGTYILVSGPVDGRYAVDFSARDGAYCFAIDPSQPEGSLDVPAGDDFVEIPNRGLVQEDVAEKALIDFLEKPMPSGSVTWEYR